MIIASFYVVSKVGGGMTLHWDHGQYSGKVAFSGNKVKRIIPPYGMKVPDIYGKILFIEDPELEDFFIILRNQTIFPLPINRYDVETLSRIVEVPDFAAEVESLKLLISFVRL